MFAEKFMQVVSTKGISAYKVAKGTGISQGLMNEYKNGVKVPTADNLKKIADYLGVTIDFLLYNDDSSANGKEPAPKSESGPSLKAIKLAQRIDRLSELSQAALEEQIELRELRERQDTP